VVTGVLLLVSIAITVTSMASGSSVRGAFTPSVLQLVHVSFVLLAFFGYIVAMVYLTNKSMEEHRGNLAMLVMEKKRDLEAFLQQCDMSSVDAESLEVSYHRCITAIQDTISCLEQLDVVFPARLFGFTIERHHMVWVGSTTALYIFVLANFLINGKLVLSF
jgi:hypothetical protein